MKYLKTLIQVVFFALFLYLIFSGKTFVWLAIFVISLIAAVLFGRIYCGYICPMNTLMKPVEWISKKLKIQTNSTPKWLQSGIVVWFALGITIIVMVISKKALNINIPVFLIWLMLSVLITLRYKPAVFHNYICPFGALQKIFGKYAKFSYTVDENKCVGCKACEEVCPTEAIKVTDNQNAVINKTYCLQCSECKNICTTKAIKYQ